MRETMFRYCKEVYLTAFVFFFRAGGADWTPGFNAGKGTAGVALIEWACLLGAMSSVDILLSTKALLHISNWIAVISFLALCGVNHYVLVVCRHGILFEREFSHLAKSRRYLLGASCLLMMLIALAFFMNGASAHRKLLQTLHQSDQSHQSIN